LYGDCPRGFQLNVAIGRVDKRIIAAGVSIAVIAVVSVLGSSLNTTFTSV